MFMPTSDPSLWLLVAAGTAVMAFIMLRSIGIGAVTLASNTVAARRAHETKLRKENADAEAAGRAASLEPLALNSDGSIEEPIIAEVEQST